MKKPPALCWVCLMLACLTPLLEANLTPGDVLVVYNDPGDLGMSDGYQVYSHYLTKRPGVLGYNLNDATLPVGRVTYAEFKTKIRDKLRAHLSTESLETTVRVIVLTKGIPHQILDINDGAVGNNAGATSTLLGESNATLASVDSELMLLWQDLDTNEADGELDSHADNFIINPYFEEDTPLPVSPFIDNPTLTTFTPVDALDDDDEVSFRYWEIEAPGNDAGILYLTARLDGDTVADAKALVDRAQDVLLDKRSFPIVLDETFSADDSNFDGSDFQDTQALLALDWEIIRHDRSGTFFVGQDPSEVTAFPSNHLQTLGGPIALLSSFGANHPGGNHTNWVQTFDGQLPYGAIFNTYESFNGQQFGGQSPASGEHGQVADWVAIGGTFGIGHVWEPFTFAVARNEILADNFYNKGLTWVEAAWSSIQVISWQNTVVGDPLARLSSSNFIDVPQVTLSLTTSPDYDSEVLEADTSAHTFTLTLDAPASGSLEIALSLKGATVGSDFSTSLPSYSSGTSAVLTIPDGATETTFTLSILDDTEAEGLEILSIAIADSSLDTNGDGIGEAYGFERTSISIPIADSPYDWWQYDQAAGPLPEIADTDQDGLINLWEYVLQTNPTVATGNTDSLKALNSSIEGNVLTFDLPKSLPSDARLILERSASLAPSSWGEIASRFGNGLWVETLGAEINIDTSAPDHDTITATTEDLTRSFRRFRLERVASP